MTATKCHHCGAPLSLSDRFCPACGQPTRAYLREHKQQHRELRADTNRSVRAMAVMFVGVLTALILVALAGLDSGWQLLAGAAVTQLAVGFLGVGILGFGCMRATLAGPASERDMGLGLLVVVPTLLTAFGYIGLLELLFDILIANTSLTLTTLIGMAVMPAVLEEWTCRGVLWEASQRILSPTNTILTTAILFAAMHGLGGGFVLEIPHRLVMGLLLGWLRHRTGSLLPGVLAHFMHNLMALAL